LVALLAAVVLCVMTGAPAFAGAKQNDPAASNSVLVSAAPTSPTDESKVPHYFGPYPNWANSPQVLADAVVKISLGTPTPVSYGNPLIERGYATDYATPDGELGPVFVVLPGSKLPAGTLKNFQTWNQVTPGGSPDSSAGGLFHAYVLRATGNVGEYTVVHDSGLQTVPTAASGEVATFNVPDVAVQAGDVIGFYGQGIPVDTGVAVNPDTFTYPAGVDSSTTPPTNVAPKAGDTLAIDSPAYPLYATQDRAYSFAATVIPTVTDPGTGAEAAATVDPKTGGISQVDVTSPGSGYVLPPTVTIDAAGVTPTTVAKATAQISTGVISSVTVNETGFGFTAPDVTFTGGNPTTPAAGTASGGVDNLTLTDNGDGYPTQPIVTISLPDLPTGTQATATATMNASGVVTSIAVVDAGSGYTKAPTVAIEDASKANPTRVATAEATINVTAIDLVSGGAGYDSAPVVAINDTVGTPDKGASATATVAVKGSVTGITVTDPGAGYLTPGLKKFVDTLPGLGEGAANNLGQYIPVAVPDTTTYPGTDYYEIAVVQYRMKFHSDLPKTLLRGYVQLSTTAVPGKQVALSNANLDPNTPDSPIAGYKGVDNPHYLGPTIVATKDKPVRILFRNLLPTGVDGDLFLPVDTSLMGSGAGPKMRTLDSNGVPVDLAPDQGTVTDGVRNPACADTPKPQACYSENRATLHLHGGITPWISDGTPHQWVTPDGETTAYPEGVSVSNVPDMPDPGPGAETFFYTNQQSARLMFYHDHAWGITRLNVYAGEAAGYLLTDDTEKKLTSPGGALDGLGLGNPLIVQDKTFVPSAAQMKKVDPTWDAAKWGGEGSLWTPHVYMPAQNPGDPSGMSAFGRWMYGPWFWPPAKNAKYPPIDNPYYDPTCDPDVQPFCEPAQIPSTPNVSVGMEAFNDTPIVNGTAYPTTTVDPKAYRYRVLNAANDRFWNLSWYVADSTGTEVALKPAELAAAQTDPVVFPTPDTAKSPKGPDWVQIGTEGGFLPAPVVVPAHETTWITDPTRFDVGNVDQHSLLLAPAERADVIVDFSQFRGKTLILYNDAPAAFPARVPGYDYFTGGPDLTPSGAPSTLPGYGPNTRTVMQVKVSSATPDLAFDRPNTTADRMGALVAAFAHHVDATTGKPAGVFESGSDPVIVGQKDYNSAYGSGFVGSGNCNSPTNPTARCDGYARINQQGGDKFKFDTLGVNKDGTGAQLAIPLQGKGIHDEMNSASFDEWGRMTANMGLEAPGATPLLQNIILYPFVNPATETLDSTNMPSSLDVTPISSAADGTQIWKITHNGVDTHPLHFHLYDVQVINRVTWDNIIIPPDPTELGWKDTVRVSPLEDTLVAVRPIVPALPFGVPDSFRPLNPMMPIGAKGSVNGPNGIEAGFNNTDANGNPIAPITNVVTDFGWEYVWHCHILSHEEMDMMRPVTVHAARNLPSAPVVTYTRNGGVHLTWTDGTPAVTTDLKTWGNPANEVGYRIERAPVNNNGSVGAYTTIGTALANATTYVDTAAGSTTRYTYRVVAFNAAGNSVSMPVLAGPAGVAIPAAPTTLVATLQSGPQVSLTWRDNATTETGFVVERAVVTAGTPGTFIAVATPPARSNTGNVTFVDTTVKADTTYTYRVTAVNGGGSSGFSNTSGVTLPPLPAAPSNLAVAAVRANGNNDTATLTWLDNATNETGFTIQRSTTAAFTTVTTSTALANATTVTQTGLARNVTYFYRVRANNLGGASGWSNVASVLTP
jgi:FtsP/CotA-like multicopper oxidase with cupredoxin domain